MSKIGLVQLFLAVFVFILNAPLVTNAQDRKTFEFENWKFQTDVLTLEKFQLWSTGLLVIESKHIKTPTIFSIETPKVKRVKVNLDFENLKNEWVAKHPRSTVIEIHHYPILTSQGLNQGREAYVWIIAEGKILNIELVRQGACSASAMLLDPENEPYILIPKYVYEEVKTRILDAEKKAQSENLGIWKTK